MNQQTIKQRLESNSAPVPEAGCWLWLGSVERGGYGMVSVGGKNRLAHRVSYEAHVGAIPEGKRVLHRCDVRCCVNPAHLFVGSDADNMRDMIAKGRSNYRRGDCHPNAIFSEEQVRAIRADVRASRLIASEYGCSSIQVRHIKSRRAWKHVN